MWTIYIHDYNSTKDGGLLNGHILLQYEMIQYNIIILRGL